jgi:DNA-binding GntR family transcriptional regulator
MAEPVKTDLAFEFLRRDILNGSFAPDQPLRVADLSERYGVSASPLREALSRLVGERLVVSAANRGWRVAPASLAEFEDLARARLAVEGAALADAIACGGLDWESAIVAAHYRLAQTPAPLGAADSLDTRQRWIEAHDAFHTALLAAGRSAWLKGFHQQTLEQLQRHHQAVLFHSATDRDAEGVEALMRLALSVPRHTRLMEIVLDRDATAARQELEAHVATMLDIFRQIVAHRAGPAPPALRRRGATPRGTTAKPEKKTPTERTTT